MLGQRTHYFFVFMLSCRIFHGEKTKKKKELLEADVCLTQKNRNEQKKLWGNFFVQTIVTKYVTETNSKVS